MEGGLRLVRRRPGRAERKPVPWDAVAGVASILGVALSAVSTAPLVCPQWRHGLCPPEDVLPVSLLDSEFQVTSQDPYEATIDIPERYGWLRVEVLLDSGGGRGFSLFGLGDCDDLAFSGPGWHDQPLGAVAPSLGDNVRASSACFVPATGGQGISLHVDHGVVEGHVLIRAEPLAPCHPRC